MFYAELGVVSDYTMQSEDLLSAFAETLRFLTERNLQRGKDHLSADLALCDEADKLATVLNMGLSVNNEHVSELIEELIDALDTFAPPYSYFGAHSDDPACYGFWLLFDSVEYDLQQVEPDLSSGDKLPQSAEQGQLFLVVSDDGSRMLYEFDKGAWLCHWSVV